MLSSKSLAGLRRSADGQELCTELVFDAVCVCFVEKTISSFFFFPFFFPQEHIGFDEIFMGKQFLWSGSKLSISE